jgi:NhaP-type Na+/H+ and K+/H+ antiporter
LSLRDLLFIAYAGMIRGAVAFGLVLRLEDSIVNREVIITSTLALVIVSTVVMGSTVSTAQKLLFGDLTKQTAVPEVTEADNRL